MVAQQTTTIQELVQMAVEQQRVELKPIPQRAVAQSVTKCSAHTQVTLTQAMVLVDTKLHVQVVAL